MTYHIVIAMKPHEGTFAENALAHGVAGLNIDEARIETQQGDWKGKGGGGVHEHWKDKPLDNSIYSGGFYRTLVDHATGRFPTNIILDDSNEVIKRFPIVTSGKPGIKHGGNDGAAYGAESRKPGTQMSGFGDSGSAARFFHQIHIQSLVKSS